MIYRVKVPATSANVGPGFDTMGIALTLYNIFDVEEIKSGLEFVGFESRYSNSTNLVYKSMKHVFKRVSYCEKGYRITLIKQEIPLTRGLGSSSSCIVAGILVANKIAKSNLTLNEIIDIANDIEGHPDNIAPAILGGFVVSVVEKSKVYYNRVELDRNLTFFAGVPNFELKTETARELLPAKYESNDVIYNISRAGLTVSAFFSKNYDILSIACNDKIHEPYRKKIIKDYDKIKYIFNKNNILCDFLSGAGPTIMGIKSIETENLYSLENDFSNLNGEWLLAVLKADNIGAIVEER